MAEANGGPPVGVPNGTWRGGARADFASMVSEVRETFVDSVWFASATLSLISLVALPIRASIYHGWAWSTFLNMGMALAMLAIFPFRRRFPPRLRAALPIALLALGSAVATVKNGLQDNGLSYLLMVNILAAMLYPRRVVMVTFALTCLVVAGAGIGFASHAIPLRFDPGYPSSAFAWTFAGLTVFGLGFIVVRGVVIYRQSLQDVNRLVLEQLEEISRQSDEITRLSTIDSLTGLPTRQLAFDRLQQACHLAARNEGRLAVLFVDVDGFKAVNDRLGHLAGDEVLRTVARRLSDSLRDADTAARLGGDEFVILLTGNADPEAVMAVANKLTAAICAPIIDGADTIHVGASIGIAVYPQDGRTPLDLIRRADAAMYRAKAAGKNQAVLYGDGGGG